MKTKEELTVLKEEYETLNAKLAELTEDELKQVTGGTVVLHNMPKIRPDEKYVMSFNPPKNDNQYDIHIYPGTATDDFEPNFGK